MMDAVVIATYNEAPTTGRLLHGLRDFRVFVVDDSSPDGTGEIASGFEHVTVISRPAKLGIASAYLAGLGAALETDAPYIVQMDAGGTHDPYYAGALAGLAALTNADLVIGSRFMRRRRLGGDWLDGWTFHGGRTLLSLGAAFLMRRLGLDVRDATSGFRCWRASFLRGLDFGAVRAEGFAFQLELLYQARRAGAEIVELPVPYRLTNSTFNAGMVREALSIYGGLWRDHVLRRSETV